MASEEGTLNSIGIQKGTSPSNQDSVMYNGINRTVAQSLTQNGMNENEAVSMGYPSQLNCTFSTNGQKGPTCDQSAFPHLLQMHSTNQK